MTEDIRDTTIETDGIIPEQLVDRRNGAGPSSPTAPRPGGSDFAMNQGGGFPPLPKELMTFEEGDKAFMTNILRTNAGNPKQQRNEIRIHASAAYREHRRVDRVSLMEGLRVMRTAEGGKARLEFLRGIGAQASMAMSRMGNIAMDMQRMVSGNGNQQGKP
jgi:hypothetical protein